MIGKVVSHYRILQKMGGGGMGVVYKAEDLKLRRTVALKFLAPELTRDDDAKKRFLHEAQAASALDHPNICGIHEIDETPEGQLFIAMTCYDGESLKDRIARRRIDVEEAFQIAFAVAQGLGCAHASGIIHRDIKPANVMITSDGFVKIIDFGLSKLLGRSRVTGSGTTLGTVAYMSPEQARSEEVDLRADLWALGAVLYEMLTGRLPFRGEIDQAVVYSILNEALEPIRNLRPEVPEACVAIVEKCLAKDPKDRYQSADEFSQAVHDAARALGWGESFTTGGVRAVSVVRPAERRRRVRPVFLVAAAAVLVMALLTWRPWEGSSPYSTEIRLAVIPLDRVGDTPSQALVDGLSQAVSVEFDRASRHHHSMWVMPFARVLEDRPSDSERVASAFGVNRVVSGVVQKYRSGYRLSLSMSDATRMTEIASRSVLFSLDSLQVLPAQIGRAVTGMLGMPAHDETLETIVGPWPDSAPACRGLLEGMGYCQRYANTASLDSAYAVLGRTADTEPESAAVLAALGYCHYARFYASRDMAELEAAEPLLSRAVELDSTYEAACLYRARVLAALGRQDEAITLLRRVIARSPSGIDAYQDLGSVFTQQQRYGEAEAVYKDLVAVHEDYFHGHWRLGWLYSVMDRPALEASAQERAHELAPDDFRTLNSLGICYSESGNWKSARECWERAFLIRPSCANSSNIGLMMYYEGRFADSARYYKYALEYCDTTDYVYWGNLAGALYWADGMHDEGVDAYHKSIRLAEARLAETPDDEITIARLADFYAMVGDDANARRMIDLSSGADGMEVYFRIACAYASLGDNARAIDFIGKAVRDQYPVHEIEREPLFRDLVKDPSLRAVLETAQEDQSTR